MQAIRSLFYMAMVLFGQLAPRSAYSQHLQPQKVTIVASSPGPNVVVPSKRVSSQAVLGWTYDQCVQAYGQPVLQRDQFPAETHSTAYVFSDKGYAIGAALFNGAMAVVSYTALDEQPLSVPIINAFTAANCPNAVWASDSASRMEGTNWTGNVNGKVVYHVNLGNDKTKLCIFTEEFMDRLKIVVRAGATIFTPYASTRDRILAGLGQTYDQSVEAYGRAADLGSFHGVEGSRYYLFLLQHLDDGFSLTIGETYVGGRISAVNYMELKDGEFLALPESTVDFFLERSAPSEAWSADASSTSKVGGNNWIGTVGGKMCYRVNLTSDRKRLTIMTDGFFNSIKVLTPDLFAVGQ